MGYLNDWIDSAGLTSSGERQDSRHEARPGRFPEMEFSPVEGANLEELESSYQKYASPRTVYSWRQGELVRMHDAVVRSEETPDENFLVGDPRRWLVVQRTNGGFLSIGAVALMGEYFPAALVEECRRLMAGTGS